MPQSLIWNYNIKVRGEANESGAQSRDPMYFADELGPRIKRQYFCTLLHYDC